MLIITYFLIFVLLISLIIISVPYINSFFRDNRPKKPAFLGREEFSEEFFPRRPGKEESPIDFNWKGNLIKDFSPQELPESYGDETLVLLIKNPTCLYAYWDITPRWKEGNPALRVYEIFSPGENRLSFLFDIYINREAKNWFIPVPKDNCLYCVELGEIRADGSFVPLLRSNPVKTPRVSLSTVIDENWIPLSLYDRLSHLSYGLSSGSLTKNQSERTDY
jgi:hypothetical protein